MTLDASGRLGVGKTPVAKLDVNLVGTGGIASLTISKATDFSTSASFGFGGLANNNDGVFFGMGAGGGNGIPAGFGFMRESSGWNTALAFYTNNITSGPNSTDAMQEKMRIDSSGNLLVGLTSYSAQNANYIALQTSGGNLVTAHASGTPSGYQYAAYLYNAGVIGSITQNGTTSVNFNGYIVNPSDQKLKTNIVDAPSSLLLIDKIQIRSFDWIAEEKNQSYGVIAQELETVFPEAVNAPTNEGGFYGVDYTKLIPMLVKAIQELSAQVTTLQTQVTALKG
jgi:hypothetical protein